MIKGKADRILGRMSHSVCVSVSLALSVCLSVSLSVCLSVSLTLSVSLSVVHLSLRLTHFTLSLSLSLSDSLCRNATNSLLYQAESIGTHSTIREDILYDLMPLTRSRLKLHPHHRASEHIR